MDISVLTFGSRGDMQPFVAIGGALRRRGHTVRILASEDQVAFVEQAGLTAVTLPINTKAVLESDRGQHLLADGKIIRFVRMLREISTEMLPRTVPAIRRAMEGADLLVAHPLMLAYPMACAGLPPVMVACTAPMPPTRHFASPLVSRLSAGPFNRLSHDVIARFGWWTARDSAVFMANAVGQPFIDDNCFLRAERMAMTTLHMTSTALVAAPPDMPAHHLFTGDVRLDPRERHGIGEGVSDPALLAFLDDGPPPVFFGFGSMPVRDPGAVLTLVEEVARTLEVRALVGAGWSSITPGLRHDGRTFVVGAFDHDAVLPRCRAAVHHGGAGTTHSAVRAGLPSVVCSFLVDQPFWADVLASHGIGARVPFPKLTAARLVRALRPLLDDDTKEKAEAIGQQMRQENGVAVAVEAIERVAGAPRPIV